MTKLSDHVTISDNFKRSIQISLDTPTPEYISNYINTSSVEYVLSDIARNLSNNSHSAFTITGSYGSGKSSFILFLFALLSSDEKIRELALKKLSTKTEKQIRKSDLIAKKNWKIISLVGRRGSPIVDIAKELKIDITDKENLENNVLKKITSLSKSKKNDGVLIVIDELGKYLEEATSGEFDIYFLQRLAELATRSDNKIIFIGSLHLSFADYARSLTTLQRNEWSKIQGRFINLPLNMAGEEQLTLISKAIMQSSKENLPIVDYTSGVVTEFINTKKQIANKETYKSRLEECYPLHPIVTCLLPSISSRRFGQQQRSIFSFLNSAETSSLKTFINETDYDENVLFTPSNLWDYLEYNLETSILVSPDGHKWSTSMEAIYKAKINGAEPEHILILKTIILIDLFKGQTGLFASEELLYTVLPETSTNTLDEILADLNRWLVIKRSKTTSSYNIFAGSDFDMDTELKKAESETSKDLIKTDLMDNSFRPVVASRHQLENGALRWFNTKVLFDFEVTPFVDNLVLHGEVGYFILVIPTTDITIAKRTKIIEKASSHTTCSIVIKEIQESKSLLSYYKELQLLEWIEINSKELKGDQIARREVLTRKTEIMSMVKNIIDLSLLSGNWINGGKLINERSLSKIASQKSDEIFKKSPIIHNEITNRIKPSGNAGTATKSLLMAMIENNGVKRLGIEGYPAHGSLFESILKETGLYKNKLIAPTKKDNKELYELWNATDKQLIDEKQGNINLLDIHKLWSKPPYGIKNGLFPILILAYFITRTDKISIYFEDVFVSSMDETFILNFYKSPKDIDIRWVDLEDITGDILTKIKKVVNKLAKNNGLKVVEKNNTPLYVAQTLIKLFDQLPTWVKRTQSLSNNAIKLRDVLKKANDPNKVLFDDLPTLFNNADNINPDFTAIELEKTLTELMDAYGNMTDTLWKIMEDSLHINTSTKKDIQELNNRAKQINKKSGNYKLNAFITRLSDYEDKKSQEGILSVLINKQPKDWIDQDRDKAEIELRNIIFEYKNLERLLSMSNHSDLPESDRKAVDDIKEAIQKALKKNKDEDILKLIAISELGINLMEREHKR